MWYSNTLDRWDWRWFSGRMLLTTRCTYGKRTDHCRGVNWVLRSRTDIFLTRDTQRRVLHNVCRPPRGGNDYSRYVHGVVRRIGQVRLNCDRHRRAWFAYWLDARRTTSSGGTWAVTINRDIITYDIHPRNTTLYNIIAAAATTTTTL